MEIKETNLQSAYNTADDNGKQMLRALFPDVRFLNNGNKQKLPITERIKTFNDACYELGYKHPYVQDYLTIDNGKVAVSPDILAYLKLRIICAALNEGWEPKFTEDEWRYYPWFYLYTQQELDNMDEEEKKFYEIPPNGYSFDGIDCHYSTPRAAYAELIDKVSGKGTWESNPWVFVYDFELIK